MFSEEESNKFLNTIPEENVGIIGIKYPKTSDKIEASAELKPSPPNSSGTSKANQPCSLTNDHIFLSILQFSSTC